MQNILALSLLLLIGYDAYSAQIIAPIASTQAMTRLNEIKNAQGSPKVTRADIELFVKDDQGLKIKNAVLRDEQRKRKVIWIDVCDRSWGEKIADKALYYVPTILACVGTDLINS